MEEDLHFKSLFLQNLHASIRNLLNVTVNPCIASSKQLRDWACMAFQKLGQLSSDESHAVLAVNTTSSSCELERVRTELDPDSPRMYKAHKNPHRSTHPHQNKHARQERETLPLRHGPSDNDQDSHSPSEESSTFLNSADIELLKCIFIEIGQKEKNQEVDLLPLISFASEPESQNANADSDSFSEDETIFSGLVLDNPEQRSDYFDPQGTPEDPEYSSYQEDSYKMPAEPPVTRLLCDLTKKGASHKLYLSVTLEQLLTHDAVVDTGADTTIMSNTLFEKLRDKVSRAYRHLDFTPCEMYVQPYAAVKTMLTAMTCICFDIGPLTLIHPVYVSPLESISLLVGQDLLTRLQPLIDLKNLKVWTQLREAVPLISPSGVNTQCFALDSSVKTTSFPPMMTPHPETVSAKQLLEQTLTYDNLPRSQSTSHQ